MATYKCISVTRRGGPETLVVVEKELRSPAAGEARIRVLATPVARDDVATRVGNRPFLPKVPFTPGYSLVGVVEAVGKGVSEVALGDHVAALTQSGGHAEKAYLPAIDLVKVPASLDPGPAATLILNYLVAYQILHRVANVKAGDKALIIGASGGVGTAFLQLGRLAGLKMYGLASPAKHGILYEHGAVPIDYHRQDFVAFLREAEPDGLHYVFNGMGEESFGPGLAVLRRGGTLVHYGGPESLPHFIWLLVRYAWYNVIPNGKRIAGYGTHREDVTRMKEDWSVLFTMLEAEDIQPVIAARIPLLEAKMANELMESGQVIGNVVLVAPEGF